ncbi:hypothetical protein PROFUN_06274 [Planoprotostelium fungivorum]|uniref:BAH domain-containing protein n=1 Tax=Planoprotostelium fungivorum TaxID=1890364 RepID=A0A2P6NEA7_9EUKA|nr:hypothetical protein PROFUN_06274 [Planoprotostelium fungivorum]
MHIADSHMKTHRNNGREEPCNRNLSPWQIGEVWNNFARLYDAEYKPREEATRDRFQEFISLRADWTPLLNQRFKIERPPLPPAIDFEQLENSRSKTISPLLQSMIEPTLVNANDQPSFKHTDVRQNTIKRLNSSGPETIIIITDSDDGTEELNVPISFHDKTPQYDCKLDTIGRHAEQELHLPPFSPTSTIPTSESEPPFTPQSQQNRTKAHHLMERSPIDDRDTLFLQSSGESSRRPRVTQTEAQNIVPPASKIRGPSESPNEDSPASQPFEEPADDEQENLTQENSIVWTVTALKKKKYSGVLYKGKKISEFDYVSYRSGDGEIRVGHVTCLYEDENQRKYMTLERPENIHTPVQLICPRELFKTDNTEDVLISDIVEKCQVKEDVHAMDKLSTTQYLCCRHLRDLKDEGLKLDRGTIKPITQVSSQGWEVIREQFEPVSNKRSWFKNQKASNIVVGGKKKIEEKKEGKKTEEQKEEKKKEEKKKEEKKEQKGERKKEEKKKEEKKEEKKEQKGQRKKRQREDDETEGSGRESDKGKKRKEGNGTREEEREKEKKEKEKKEKEKKEKEKKEEKQKKESGKKVVKKRQGKKRI